MSAHLATAPLLVELFVEELPPKALKTLGEAFARLLADGLRAEGLADAAAEVVPFASPRRLGAHVSPVRARAADQALTHKLMPTSVGLAADGTPTPALLKKLAALGEGPEAVSRLARAGEGKAETLMLATTRAGATLAEGLQRALHAAVEKLPIPKIMQYPLDDGWQVVHFVRPAHGLVALHGAAVVPVSVLGLSAGRTTHGHRFEARVDPVVIPHADAYESVLAEDGAVVARFAARREEIVRQLAAAGAAEGLRPIDDEALLDEVTALVERPTVLRCRFEPEFLAVPQECLILTMKANQKYFPLLDAAGRLTDRFLVVSNIRPADPSAVVGGNERVVRPRLADARFFFEQDRRRTLDSRVPGLDKVVYHGQLGSQGERVARVRAIARALADAAGQGPLAGLADRAARLAKADLLTDMVGEFPELQGIMGGYYARHDGEPEAVALAVEDHYRPRFAGDALPRDPVGVLVALADKLETLVGLFGIGQLPTGDKDPFALRRHALGVIRMLREAVPALALDRAIDTAIGAAAWPAAVRVDGGDGVPALRERLLAFFRDRLSVMLRDEGYPVQAVEAVLEVDAAGIGRLSDRLQAVQAFAAMPESAALAAANKRIANILKKAGAPVDAATLDPARLVEPAESALHAALDQVGPASAARLDAGDYTGCLQALAALKAPVDAFFDRVMVNAEDPGLRANRLALLAALHAAMNRVADLSRLAA
jgi:glycyl-tRNA synthetase beta chain